MKIEKQPRRQLTVVIPYTASAGESSRAQLARQLSSFAAEELVARLIVLHEGDAPQLSAPPGVMAKVGFIQMSSWLSGAAVARVLEAAETDILLLMPAADELEMEDRALEEFLAAAEATGAGLVYSDFRVVRGREVTEHALCDYQLGSIRETFDFGGMVLIVREAAREALKRHGRVSPELLWAGFYDLRLKLSADFPVQRIPQPLYARCERRKQATPSAEAQAGEHPAAPQSGTMTRRMEVEQVATEHLRRIGAYLEPQFSAPPPPPEGSHTVTASIIIPVRNREQTIADALRSALEQKTSFPYNVIVVDDHSTDRTGAIVREFTGRHANLLHLIPERIDLGVGGLWNHALYSQACGLFAVQLDSDDVYADASVLQKIVDKFYEAPAGAAAEQAGAPRYALVVGSFAQVDFQLKEIAGGRVRHRDITPENGSNNALRADGLGAPRAFYVPVLRRLGFPNLSFGEDYAICLRISREYEVGRIFEILYWARRWKGNTNHSLPLGSPKSINLEDLIPGGAGGAQALFPALRPVIASIQNASRKHYQHYKDWLRTKEIRERINLNRRRLSS